MKINLVTGVIVILLSTVIFSCIMNTEPLKKEPDVVFSPPLKIMSNFISIEKYPIIVIPYFVNLFSIQLLKDEKHVDDIRDYIYWYLDHLNYPDKYGNTGSVYDYRLFKNGDEESLNTYDSVDSYAATFIELIYKYWNLTGDYNTIYKNHKKLKDIAYLIAHLQKDDGLTIASQKSEAKYLMDNCEVYSGTRYFILLSEYFNWDLEQFYREVKKRLKKGITEEMFDKINSNFYWGKVGTTKNESDWNILYPDSLAQLFPLLHRVIPDRYKIKKDLWDKFNRYHGDTLVNLPVEQKLIYNRTKEVIENENYN